MLAASLVVLAGLLTTGFAESAEAPAAGAASASITVTGTVIATRVVVVSADSSILRGQCR
jgi:hypothetical protein